MHSYLLTKLKLKVLTQFTQFDILVFVPFFRNVLNFLKNAEVHLIDVT